MHPNMTSGWKRAAIKNMAAAFRKDTGSAVKDNEVEINKSAFQDRPAGGGTRFFETGLRSLRKEQRQICIENGYPRLSMRWQCWLLSLTRSGLYYHPVG
jgi:putative transposase